MTYNHVSDMSRSIFSKYQIRAQWVNILNKIRKGKNKNHCSDIVHLKIRLLCFAWCCCYLKSWRGARKRGPKQSYLPNFDIKNGCSQDQDFKQMEQSRKETSSASQIYVNQFINYHKQHFVFPIKQHIGYNRIPT